ncbi:S-adenosyl-L-methionine-dependent methyltransferase [Stipitochalara longipes BDJ]|nr:S-adenosyl-L-methionine-dependent methyltransferase [Stipitochalara longipes BDJ]
MVKDRELAELAFPQYWDERYKAEQKGQAELESYEWFRSFHKLKPFFDKNLPPLPSGSNCHILHLGCGNSTLTADLHRLGYTNQTSVDFSQVVIDAMKSKYAQLDTRWLLMDLRELELPDASVDIAVDKSTLDAFLHGSLWDPPDDVRTNVGKYVDEVARVLRPGGLWLYITYRQPHFMKPLLTREKQWDLSVEALEDPDGAGGFDYFGFVMKKTS